MFSKVLLISSLISVAFASLSITQPVASTTYIGGQSALVSWMDNGDNKASSSLTAFGPSKVAIWTGNSLQQTSLQLINGSLDVSTVSSVNFTVDPTIGPNSNHYFIRIDSINGKNGTEPLLSFSGQFTLTNMTGSFSPAVLSEIAGLSTAPLGPPTPTATGASSSITSLLSTHSSSTPSATGTSKASSGAISIKAGWTGLVFGAIVGVTMF